jgi:hypothetical protein
LEIEAVHLNLEDDRENSIYNMDTGVLGKSTAKSAYKIQFEGQCLSNFPKLIWKRWAPPKVQVFLVAATPKQIVDVSETTIRPCLDVVVFTSIHMC